MICLSSGTSQSAGRQCVGGEGFCQSDILEYADCFPRTMAVLYLGVFRSFHWEAELIWMRVAPS